MTRVILALYDSANAEQVKAVKAYTDKQYKFLYLDDLLTSGVWLCPVDAPDFPSEAMDVREFFAWYEGEEDDDLITERVVGQTAALDALGEALGMLPDSYRVMRL